MINAHQVEQFQLGTEARAPPGEIVCLHRIPSVMGIAPVLASFRKIIRRNAGDSQGFTLLVEHELLLVGPDVGAVVSDKDGDITK
jgi:hypothetical protein